jgi:YD repeat-containing protein
MTRMTTIYADIEYRYSATQNDGRIASSKDWVTGEEVTYTYDTLERMVHTETTGPQWGQSYSYDGFGNLTGKSVTKGTAAQLPWVLTRRRTGL